MKIRPAMTAIAAVIALSSTPLFAQVADEPITTEPAPVVETAPAPVATPAPVSEDPLAPEPSAEATTAADPLAAKAPAKPVARKATTAKTTATARSRPQPARVASAALAVAAAPAAVSPAPPVVTPTEPVPPVQPEVAPVAAPVEQPPVTSETNMIAMDEMAPAAGAGALALLALAGAGLVVRRRRRRKEAAEFEARQEYAESLAEPAMGEPKPGYMPEQAEPAFVRAFAPAAAAPAIAPAATPSPSAEVDGPVTPLPEGFDLSRFGPHVQAAYKGPTEDNPSLSLKYRLRRATAMDQMARKDAAETVTAGPVRAPAAQPAMTRHDKADFMLVRSGAKPSMRPASISNGRPAYGN